MSLLGRKGVTFVRKRYAFTQMLRKKCLKFHFFFFEIVFSLICVNFVFLHYYSSVSFVVVVVNCCWPLMLIVLMERFEAETEAVEVLLPMVTTTGPFLTSLKSPMASWWVMPCTGTLLMEKISSPGRMSNSLFIEENCFL